MLLYLCTRKRFTSDKLPRTVPTHSVSLERYLWNILCFNYNSERIVYVSSFKFPSLIWINGLHILPRRMLNQQQIDQKIPEIHFTEKNPLFGVINILWGHIIVNQSTTPNTSCPSKIQSLLQQYKCLYCPKLC